MYIRQYQGTDENKLLAVWATTMDEPITKSMFQTKALLGSDFNFQANTPPVTAIGEHVVAFALALTWRASRASGE